MRPHSIAGVLQFLGGRTGAIALPILRYPVKWRSVGKAPVKHVIHCPLSTSWALAVIIHSNGQLRPAAHAALVLASEASVPSQKLLLKVAVTAEAGSPHFTAGVVFTIGPVQVCASAVVVSMDQLVRQHVRHLFLG